MKNDKGFDCFKLAADLGANGSAVLQSLSLNTYGFELFVFVFGYRLSHQLTSPNLEHMLFNLLFQRSSNYATIGKYRIGS
jgi:hypothetical protein